MGKRRTTKERADSQHTRILFMKSNESLQQSRTASGSTGLHTKSGILKIKKRRSKTQQHTEGKTLKRDLSIETDKCVLRRYYKKKRNRRSLTCSEKSKYSEVADAEIETIEEFPRDVSACGDSDSNETANNIQLDITKMMMDNLQGLLNDWIKSYLLENRETKDKLETVLYSIIHKTEREKTNTASFSRSMYFHKKDYINREVKHNTEETSTKFCRYCGSKAMKHKVKKINNDQSCHTMSGHLKQGARKNCRIISTLSIPRNIHHKSRHETEERFKNPKKAKHKNLVLSINKSNKFITISSFDLLTISTKSFTKRCAACDSDGGRKREKKRRHIVFLPKASFKSATDSSLYEIEEDIDIKVGSHNIFERGILHGMPSLVKSLFADDTSNFSSTNNTMNYTVTMKDDCTMTDFDNPLEQLIKVTQGNTYNDLMKPRELHRSFQNQTFQNNALLSCCKHGESDIILDFMNQSLKVPNKSVAKVETFQKNITSKPKLANTHDVKLKKKRNNKRNIRNKVVKYQRVRSKRFTYTYQSPEREVREENNCDYINPCQSKLKYVVCDTGSKNLKLDIEIKILPTLNQGFKVETTNQDKFTAMSTQKVTSATAQNCTSICNAEPIMNEPISYIYECLKVPSANADRNQLIVPLLDGAASQAQYIFKNDSNTTKSDNNNAIFIDKFTTTDDDILKDINELKGIIRDLTMAAEVFIREHLKKQARETYTNKTTSTLLSLSRGVQYIDEMTKPRVSGIKLFKEPKRNTSEFYHRLMKKSTSYNIISSESILKVTDMTSAANSNKSEKKLLRSKSVIEICNEKNRTLLAYFYKECQQKLEKHNMIGSHRHDYQAPSPTCSKKWDKKNYHAKPLYQPNGAETTNILQVMNLENKDKGKDKSKAERPCRECFNDYIYDIDDEEKGGYPETCRKGIGFGEGMVYCLLLWIPIIILFILLYQYIIKDHLYPRDNAVELNRRSGKALKQIYSNTTYNVKLSDLGF